MAKIWLPVKDPRQTNREVILYIPGASTMDPVQLRDILQKQQEVIPQELAAQPVNRPRYSKAEIAGALREFRDHLEKRGRRP